jgi:ATP-binding cassette, subfamily G (WHITE), member 2, SNQ2
MSVPGLQYAQAFDHHYDRRWRNIGIMIALGVAYMIASVVGSEIMRFTPQGGSPFVYAKRKEKKTRNPSLAVDVEKKAPIVPSSSQSSSAPKAHHSGPSLAWKDLTVDIDGKMILNGIMGYVRPGDFIALCGASGAGKTTMLNALSQTNLTGQLGGEVSFGGRPPGEWFKNMRGK